MGKNSPGKDPNKWIEAGVPSEERFKPGPIQPLGQRRAHGPHAPGSRLPRQKGYGQGSPSKVTRRLSTRRAFRTLAPSATSRFILGHGPRLDHRRRRIHRRPNGPTPRRRRATGSGCWTSSTRRSTAHGACSRRLRPALKQRAGTFATGASWPGLRVVTAVHHFAARTGTGQGPTRSPTMSTHNVGGAAAL